MKFFNPNKEEWPYNIDKGLNDKTIKSYLGSSFDNYLKIFHSVYIDIEDDGVLSHDEVDRLHRKDPKNAFQKLLADSTLIGQGVPIDLCENRQNYRRVFWEDLFGLKGLEFKNEANPNVLREKFGGSFPSNLYGLTDYGFDCIEFTQLSELLFQYGYETINCYYDYLSSGKLSLAKETQDAEVQFQMKSEYLNELIVGERPEFWSTPNYMWTNDKSFLIWSDYDLPYSFIGCNDYFYGLIRKSSFEYLEVKSNICFTFLNMNEYMSA